MPSKLFLVVTVLIWRVRFLSLLEIPKVFWQMYETLKFLPEAIATVHHTCLKSPLIYYPGVTQSTKGDSDEVKLW